MLTPKQETFCLEYLKTGNASEAYRRAYSAGKMSAGVIHVKANQVLKNGKVAVRLEELRAPAREKAGLTLEQHLDDLKRLRDLAEADGKFSAAVTAEVARGKAAGLHVDKHELTGKGGKDLIPPTGIVVEFVAPIAKKS